MKLPIFRAVALLWFAGSAALMAWPDYLLSETPIDTDEFDLKTSLDGFRLGQGLSSPFGAVLLDKDVGRGLLIRQIPTSEPFFDDAVVLLRPRIYHRYARLLTGRKVEATAAGGALELRSGWWNESIQIGLGAYMSQKLYGPPDRGPNGLLTPDQGGITVLGEAWLKIKHEDWLAEVGRSSLDVPYINRNDSRMIPNTFEAASLIYQPCEELSVGAGHISRIKLRDSDEFISMSRAAGAFDQPSRGVTSAGLQFSGSDQISLGLFNHYGWDTFNTTYLEMQWKTPDNDTPCSWSFGLQATDQRSVGKEWVGSFNTRQFGARAVAGFDWLTASLITTFTADNAGIRNSWGGSPSYASSMNADFDRAGEWAGRLIVQSSLDPLVPGLGTMASVAHGDTSDGLIAGKQDELDLTVDYRPPLFDQLWLRVRHAWRTLDGKTSNDFRVVLNYETYF